MHFPEVVGPLDPHVPVVWAVGTPTNIWIFLVNRYTWCWGLLSTSASCPPSHPMTCTVTFIMSSDELTKVQSDHFLLPVTDGLFLQTCLHTCMPGGVGI